MKNVQTSEMTEELWKSYAKFRNFLNKEIYTEKRNGKVPDWQELKNESLKNTNLSDDSFSNFYYLFRENESIAFIEATIRFGNLYFDFDCFKKIITEDDIIIVLEEIYMLMKERNICNAFFGTFYERHYQPVVKAGIEVYDETVTSKAVKKGYRFFISAEDTR